MWESRNLPMREIGDDRLVRARSRGSPLKGSTSLWGPLILVILVLGLHIALDQLEIEATRQFTLVATSESSFFLFSCKYWVATLESSFFLSFFLSIFLQSLSGNQRRCHITLGVIWQGTWRPLWFTWHANFNATLYQMLSVVVSAFEESEVDYILSRYGN